MAATKSETSPPPLPFHQAQNRWCVQLTWYPEAENAHVTVEETWNVSNSGGGWRWGVERESWVVWKDLKGQKHCVERKEIASKAERIPCADQGDIHLGSPQRSEPRRCPLRWHKCLRLLYQDWIWRAAPYSLHMASVPFVLPPQIHAQLGLHQNSCLA